MTNAAKGVDDYRLGVGIMLLNADNQVLVAQRIDKVSDAWQMPQGGIDQGEDPLATAFRELAEEIGTNDAEVITETDGWLTYDLPEDLRAKLWRGRYKGQRQKWYAMRYLGRDEDINLETEHPEFSAWKWASIDDLPDLIVPFKRPLYEQIVAVMKDKVGL